MPDGLEDNALAGSNLSGIASSPDGPMFEHASLFGGHLASAPLACAEDAPEPVSSPTGLENPTMNMETESCDSATLVGGSENDENEDIEGIFLTKAFWVMRKLN